ncbi:PAS domain-containing protein [Streptomyces sp. NBC_00435]|uniref:PAS domain-containing protein n=1 Tax=Streptomyces sp. NBC_00435 TaxID=2903649 RepID=UPI002E23DDD8
MTASGRSETADDLLAALLDGMDAALCAFDSDGVITHWNREAERILGWSAGEAVGRKGFAGWAVRSADAQDVQDRLMAAQEVPGRQVHEFALLTKDGGRVLVRTQSAGVPGAGGKPAGVYCAFSEVHAQIDLERSIALSEALMEDASWGVVLLDVDLRPAVVNAHAARAFGSGRTVLLGRPLGELLAQGVEDLEEALQHVLAEGAPPEPVELWVSVRTPEGVLRRCWRCGFLRLASPLAEEPVPLGVGLLFQDVTEARQAQLDAAQLRFRCHQLYRAGRAAAECGDPAEAAAVRLEFALAGFAEHALLDVLDEPVRDLVREPVREPRRPRLLRLAAFPPGVPGLPEPGALPVRYAAGHPALQALERSGSVRTSTPPGQGGGDWAGVRRWPEGSVHALCTVLRSRGGSLGVLTFLRGPSRPAFERADAEYAEEVAARVAADLDLAGRERRDDRP